MLCFPVSLEKSVDSPTNWMTELGSLTGVCGHNLPLVFSPFLFSYP